MKQRRMVWKAIAGMFPMPKKPFAQLEHIADEKEKQMSRSSQQKLGFNFESFHNHFDHPMEKRLQPQSHNVSTHRWFLIVIEKPACVREREIDGK